ncbi:MAG: zinc ribbon domain-containing protein [Candidatus Aminicenantes bacterium]|nr:zinc ribbon domain-containing protein [Candidatus Aminicenantes bacterium]
MALVACPECGKSVSEKARSCPNCGYPLKAGSGYFAEGERASIGYEYKSSKTLFGMPLVHIVYGPSYGKILKPAKGFIAIGNVAIGVISIGGIAIGLISLGGIGLGLVCLGGVALGILGGAGGLATGYIAIGGVAIGTYAIGGVGIGAHTLQNDPQLREYIQSLIKNVGGL